jgi:hypothetical protein
MAGARCRLKATASCLIRDVSQSLTAAFNGQTARDNARHDQEQQGRL